MMNSILKILVASVFLLCGGAGISCSDEKPDELRDPVLEEVIYTMSDADFPNPERGFYKQLTCHLGKDGPLSLSTLRSYREMGYTLILRMYYLKDFRDGEISAQALEVMEEDMKRVREAGVKVILRMAYSENENEPDAPLETIMMHLNQLESWFDKNYDVIAVMQAGLIGAWGEWYYSSNNLNSSGPRAVVLDKILEVLPENRAVQVRTPQYKMQYLRNQNPLQSAEAFTGTKKARIGHHNDCFLASLDDYGTYQDIEEEKNYLNVEGQYLPVGGETCPPSDIDPADCGKATDEMRYLRWSFINEDYYRGVNDRWKEQGCMNDIRKEMGYRFVLDSGAYTPSVTPGHTMTVNLKLKNVGFAPPYNPRLVEFVLKNTSTNDTYKLIWDADPRRWKPGMVNELEINAGLPDSILEGEYQLYLSLPDPEPALYERYEYSIRMGNNNVWHEDTGFNDLQMTISVNANQDTEKYVGSHRFEKL